MAKTTIKITHKEGNTVASNDKGYQWTFPNMDSETAIASMVFFTLHREFEKCKLLSEDFVIEFSMDAQFE